MANYPKFPIRKPVVVDDLHTDVSRWANELTRELDTENLRQATKPSTNIYTVVTVTNIGSPQQGDVAFSVSSTKFKGYTGSAWVDFH